MAIIDPEGFFSGERLAACSDLAQFCWPRFFLAANSCGRIELSYKSLISRVFGNFQDPPKSDKLWEIFREYENNFLAVLYESESGVWWCQFITSEKYLPKYKKTRDEQSPAPTSEMMEAHRRGYLEWKKSKSFKNQSFQKLPTLFSSEGVGIGVGVGVGKGGEKKKEQKQIPSAKDKPSQGSDGEKIKQTKAALVQSRHDAFKDAIKKYWAGKNPDVEMPWGPAEGKTLAIWLKESPTTTLEQFIAWLRNRFKSEVNHTDRPSKWIRNVTMFASGPIDRFGKPLSLKNMNGGHHAAVPSGTGNQIVGVLERTLAGRQRNRALSEDGDLPTSGEVRRNDIEPVHGVFAPVGPSSLPSGYEEPSAKPKAGGGDGLPYPW